MNLKSSQKFRQSFAVLSLLVLTSTATLSQSVYSRPSAVPQPIPNPTTNQAPAGGPLVRTTASANPSSAARPDVAFPSLEPIVSGSRGVLVETVDGKKVLETMSNVPFNPASNIKMATALAALKTLKPNYRFQTKIYTNGIFNQQTGVLEGNLYVVGQDPSFNYEQAIAIAAALNKLGIRQVNGDLVVAPTFTIAFNPSAMRSGVLFYDSLDANRRSAAAVRAWQNYLLNSGQSNLPQAIPSVAVMRAVTTGGLPSSNLRLLATHESSPLKDILKVCLSYSNNFIAERIGDALGGVYTIERVIQQEARIPAEEFQIASASGLGINRVTPRAMMRIFRALHGELSRYKMSPTDILPVAGVDEGTLKNRFADFRARGSVIGKTGTLPSSDGGVSSLVGQMATASGEILFFVIFNQHGNINRFRDYQNQLISYLQNQRGGAATFAYFPKSFPAILANTRVITENSVSN